jgi:hypothetical protein
VILHRPADGSVVCVGQASHAWISGQLARAWGTGDFAAPDPFEDVCLGVEQHDAGMAEWDRDPDRDPETGLPVEFLKLPVDVHLALWRAAPGKVLTQSPYAALLVSMHGAALQRSREPTPEIRAYLAEQEALQARLLADLGVDPAQARQNQRLLWALDHLSLALLVDGWCPARIDAPTRPGADLAVLDVAWAPDGDATVTPWPFAAARVRVACWGRRPEPSGELRDANWTRLRFTLRPGDPRGVGSG